MTRQMKMVVLVLLVLALGGVLFLRGQRGPSVEPVEVQSDLPRLIDLATSSCPACKESARCWMS